MADLSNTIIDGDPFDVNEGSTELGNEYDLVQNSALDEVTLTEDGTDKTTLPLVATFIGSQSDWNNLSASEQAKYRILHIISVGNFERDVSTGTLTSIIPTLTGATANANGASGIPQAPLAGQQGHLLTGDANWTDPANVTVGNSAKLNGYASDTAATANTVVRRQANGYVYATYYNQSSSEESSATNARPCIIDGSGWHRKFGIAAFRNLLGLGNTTGALPIANGGTGATTAANALNNLGIAPSSVVDKSSSLSGKGELKYQTIGQLVIVTGRLYGLSSIPTNTLPKPTTAIHVPLAGTGNVQGYLLLETNGVISVSVENTNAGAQGRFNFSYVKA